MCYWQVAGAATKHSDICRQLLSSSLSSGLTLHHCSKNNPPSHFGGSSTRLPAELGQNWPMPAELQTRWNVAGGCMEITDVCSGD